MMMMGDNDDDDDGDDDDGNDNIFTNTYFIIFFTCFLKTNENKVIKKITVKLFIPKAKLIYSCGIVVDSNWAEILYL